MKMIQEREGEAIIVGAFVIGVGVRHVYLVIAMSKEVVPWYLVPEVVLFAIGVSLIITVLLHPVRVTAALRATLMVGFVGLVALGTVYFVTDNRDGRTANAIPYDTAIWIKENLPTQARLAMYDSGYISYISGKDTLALNGLATDYGTMEALRDGARWDVLRQFEVGYLIQIMSSSVGDKLPDEAVLHRTGRTHLFGSFDLRDRYYSLQVI